MNAMKMPGFTASSSLYKTNRAYRVLGVFVDAEEIVNPASGGSFCLPGCLTLCLKMGESEESCIINCCVDFLSE